MDAVPPRYNPHSVEVEVLSLWRGRHLPPPGGVLGPPSGSAVRQFIGAWAQGDFPSLVAQRAVAADVDARYLELVGRRAVGTLRQGTGSGAAVPSTIPALLVALGVWTGGDGQTPWDAEDRTAGVRAIVGRLASKGILATRDDAFRVCPSCGAPRGPERIVYDEEEGDTFLVRFPVRIKDLTVNSLVWVDAPWKLLGTTALLLNPDLKYVVADYRRREDREFVLTSHASLARLRSWIPEAHLEVVEERPGRDFQGIAYSYPLRHEFPMGGDLAAPAGALLTASEVSESGTGIVPLVPGHGPTDARIAGRLGVPGWPLITPKGKLDFTLMHKYAGLDLDTADEFVLRDLSEAGALLARLRVKRGVPHCALCGAALLWTPGRAWCLEPSRLPPERRALFSRLLPDESLPGPAEVAPWPVSETVTSEDPTAVALLECTRCDRLDGPEGPTQCPCGGPRQLVRRRLLPSSEAAFAAWARFDPFPDGDSVHLYVGDRRRVPAVVNHLAALSGVQGFIGDMDLTVVPTVAAADAQDLVATHSADAVRAAFVRSGLAESSGGHFADRCRQEADRIQRWWSLSEEVATMCDPAMLAAFARPIGGFLEELEVEDRAILARWERTRTLALAHYDHWAPALVHRRAFRFLDNDLVEYRGLVGPRLALAGTPTTKRAALRTLVHLLRGLSGVLAPILPFTSESIHRRLSAERTSVFEGPMAGIDRALLNDELVAAWDRWGTVLRSIDRFRRFVGLSRSTVLPSAVLVLPADDIGDKIRAETETLARLGRVQRFEVASPRQPWTGRQRTIRPIESEIQKSYPAQASQIVHLLQHMAPRRWETAAGHEDLSVVINGLPHRVFPNMVAFSDTLPPHVIPFPWSLGEMYLELPTGAGFAGTPIPPLSSDALWLVRRLERRLRSGPVIEGAPTRVAIVSAKDPLASELRAAAEGIAVYLGLRELRVAEKSEELIPPTALIGRTRTGDRWWVHVPNLPARLLRAKRTRVGTRMQRVSVALAGPPPEFDYADERFVAHEQEIRGLGQELDDIIGIPLLGPSKVAAAWDQGIHSVDDLRRSPFEMVSKLPGFGGPVAEVVVSKLGGIVPPLTGRHVRRGPETEPPSMGLPPPSAPAPTIPAPAMSLLTTTTERIATPPSPLPGEEVLGIEASSPPPLKEEPLVVDRAPLSPGVSKGDAGTEEGPAADSMAPAEQEEPTEPGAAEVEATAGESAPESANLTPESHVPPLESANVDAVATLPTGQETPSIETPAPEPPLKGTGVPLESPVAEMELTPPEEPPPSEGGPMPEPEVPIAEERRPPPDVLIEPPPAATDATQETGAPSATPEPIPTSADVESLEGVSPPSPGLATPETVAPAPESTEIPPETTEPPRAGEEVEPAPESVRDTAPPTEAQAPEESRPSEPPAEEAVTSPQTVEETTSAPAEPSDSTGTLGPPEGTLPLPQPEIEGKTEEVVAPSPPEIAVPTPVVVSAAPALVSAPPEPPSPPSGVELMVGESLVVSLGAFFEATAAGHHGVCVVRESPERIRARVGSRPIEVFWLTNIGRGPALRPADLEGAWAFLAQKLQGERVTAFFLEGVEYLVRLHGADAVLNGLVQFDRLARENDARVWIYLAPGLMKPDDLERFRSTFGGGPVPS